MFTGKIGRDFAASHCEKMSGFKSMYNNNNNNKNLYSNEWADKIHDVNIPPPVQEHVWPWPKRQNITFAQFFIDLVV